MQTEAIAYEHYYTQLAANDTTINTYTYKGHSIAQKADGYYVDGSFYFTTMQQVKHAIDKSITALSIEELLEAFRKRFYLSRVMVYANCMVYKTAAGKSKLCADDANKLITELGLPLTATSTTFYTEDSFVVEKKEPPTPKGE